jgi:hypothetical protein
VWYLAISPPPNLICLPSCILKLPMLKKSSLTFIRPLQNCESLGFLVTCVIALELRYLFLMSCCQAPSELIKLKSHLLRRHLFCNSRFKTPKPRFFGLQIMPHFASLYFFLWLFPCQKIWIYRSPVCVPPLSVLRKTIT